MTRPALKQRSGSATRLLLWAAPRALAGLAGFYAFALALWAVSGV